MLAHLERICGSINETNHGANPNCMRAYGIWA